MQILQILLGYLNKLLPETKRRPLLSSANNEAKSEIESSFLEATTRPLNQSAFLRSSVGKASACNAGDLGLIPGSGSSPGEGNGNPLQCSCLENPTDRGAWQTRVHRVTKTQARLSALSFFIMLRNNNSYLFVIYHCRLNAHTHFPGGPSKEPACQCRRRERRGFDPWVGKIPWRREWQPTPVFLPGESHGQRRLAGYSPWGLKGLDLTEVT